MDGHNTCVIFSPTYSCTFNIKNFFKYNVGHFVSTPDHSNSYCVKETCYNDRES